MTDAQRSGSLRSTIGLDALSFLLAMGEASLLYLPMSGMTAAEPRSGIVPTLVILSGLIAQTPVAALVDFSRHKRTVVIAVALLVMTSGLLPLYLTNSWLSLATRIVGAIAATAFLPLFAGITLGLVGPRRYAKRVGRNEAFQHAGAGIASLVVLSANGSTAIVWVMVAALGLSIGATLLIPARQIDDEAARGLEPAATAEHEQRSGRRPRFGIKYLALFALLILTFQLAYGMVLQSQGRLLVEVIRRTLPEPWPSLFYVPIVTATVAAIPVALLVGAKTDAIGRKPVFVAVFGSLIIDCLLFTFAEKNGFWVVGLSLLGAVIVVVYHVMFSVVVADLTHGSGSFNTALGAVATVQRAGAWISPSLFLYVMTRAGEPAAYLWFAGIATVGLALYLTIMPETRRVEAAQHVPESAA